MTTRTPVKTKRPSHAEVRRKALLDARATVRADLLLDSHMTLPEALERITRSIDRLIDAI
jgi:hypothetical protein